MLNKVIENMDFSTGWWYPVTLGIILILFVIFMPKRLNWREIYLTMGVIAASVWIIDTIVSVWLDVFDIGKKGLRGIPELFLYSVIPPSIAVIYLNYYIEEKKLMYSILFTALSFTAEWLAVAVGLMKLHQWRPIYSIPVYLVVYYFLLPLHLTFLKSLKQTT
ncbi:hypothetical protein [Brevibacillus migulae]|uniref:hypothetical protein n=1 Tax=Brevibacillus migulae TaxID=1644114 RepID=UPI00106E0A4E|nr:hypothetical protein [Brevibacillus migulae]